MSRQVLFVFGPQACIPDDGLGAARRLGYRTTVFGPRLACCMSAELVDRFERCDLRRPDAVVDAARRLHAVDPIAAAIAYDDQAVPVVARITKALDLPGHPPSAADASRDKLVMKRRFDAAGLPIAPYHLATDEEDAVAWAGARGYPVVVKPVRGSASQGVIRADSEDELRRAYRTLRRIVSEHGLDTAGRSDAEQLIEGFLPGGEYSVELLIQGGKPELLCVFEKPTPLEGPFFEESVYISPTRLATEPLQRLEELALAGVEALGLTDGAAHCEIRLDGEAPHLLEIGGRLIGGACARVFNHVLEDDIHDLLLRIALGQPLPELRRRPGVAGAMMLPIPGKGRLREVRGVAQARGVPGIRDVILNASPGDLIVPFPEQSCYVGFLTASGASFEAVEEAFGTASGHIDLDLEPVGCEVLTCPISRQASYRPPEELGIRSLAGVGLGRAEQEVVPLVASTHFRELPEAEGAEKALGCVRWLEAGNRGQTAPEAWFVAPRRGVALGSSRDGTAYVSLVGVIPESRRTGLASALVQSVMGYFAQRGCERMEVAVEADRPGGSGLFTSLGFAREECAADVCCSC